MRPVLLEFAGLHSYREPQAVDFAQLLGAGLFGIFGPTGSGKSTILDAITLALYGEVDRAPYGTHDILNQAEDRLWVRFSFALAGAGEERRFGVERHYRRRRGGGLDSAQCRLVEVTGAGDTVLADTTSAVNQQVREILGLPIEDFTRAVVLPQGKFADFLRLQGRERRDMLQRIFSLGQYGDQLTRRLNAQAEQARGQLEGVKGELQGLGDASAAAVSRAEQDLQQAEEAARAAADRLGQAEQAFQAWQKVWELQRELEGVQTELAARRGREAEVDALRAALRASQRADGVRRYVEDDRQAQQQLVACAAEAGEADKALAEAQQEAEEAAAALQQAQVHLQQEGQRNAARRTILEQAMAVEAQMKEVAGKTEDLAERLRAAQAEAGASGAAVAALEEEIEGLRAEQERVLAELSRCTVEPGERERVRQAADALARLRQAEARAAQKRKDTADAALLVQKAAQAAELAEEQLGAHRTEQQALEENPPAAPDAALLPLWRRQVEAAVQAAAELQQVHLDLAGRDLEAVRLSLQAAAVAAHLRTGAPCPVCGSTVHPHPAAADDHVDLAAVERAHQAAWALQAARAQLPEAWREEEPEDLPGLLAQAEAKLAAWQQQVEAGKKRQAELQQAAEKARLDAAALRARLEAHQAALAELEGEAHTAGLTAAGLDPAAVEADQQRIQAADQAVPVLKGQLDELGRSIPRKAAALAQQRADHQARVQAVQDLQQQHATAHHDLESRRQALRQLAGDEPPGPQLAALEAAQRRLEAAARQAAEADERARSRLQQASRAQTTAVTQLDAARRRRAEAATALGQALAEAGFASAEAAAAALLAKEQQQELAESIRRHEQAVHTLESQERQILQQLAGRSLTPEQWAARQAEYAAVKEVRERATARHALAEQALQDIRAKHARWTDLEARRSALSTRLGYLEALQRVLRGNAFVDFLAEDQLQQVALAASQRLGQLTRYRYALEVNSEGGFLVRDDANGGVRRPVSTLSGGETFLTSLALAVALSSQIQLRGRYPLEFFFLDEGFGTLDPDLLSLAIDALERLHLERLHVGVITHVPEVRQRLARRLIVEPAEPGGRGSRVRLEMA